METAGAIAPELPDLAQQVEARRHQNQARLIASLHEAGALRHDLSAEEATDVLWALTSFDLYRMLVVEQRWEPERYETWLAQLLTQHLLASSWVMTLKRDRSKERIRIMTMYSTLVHHDFLFRKEPPSCAC